MGKKKFPHTFIDVRGNFVKQFKDGGSEIYMDAGITQEELDAGKKVDPREFMEITDGTDTQVNRKRFMRDPNRSEPQPILTRDDAVPGSDDLDGD